MPLILRSAKRREISSTLRVPVFVPKTTIAERSSLKHTEIFFKADRREIFFKARPLKLATTQTVSENPPLKTHQNGVVDKPATNLRKTSQQADKGRGFASGPARAQTRSRLIPWSTTPTESHRQSSTTELSEELLTFSPELS